MKSTRGEVHHLLKSDVLSWYQRARKALRDVIDTPSTLIRHLSTETRMAGHQEMGGKKAK